MEYLGELEIKYDSCSEPKKINWDSIMNSFASNPAPTTNSINITNTSH